MIFCGVWPMKARVGREAAAVIGDPEGRRARLDVRAGRDEGREVEAGIARGDGVVVTDEGAPANRIEAARARDGREPGRLARRARGGAPCARAEVEPRRR